MLSFLSPKWSCDSSILISFSLRSPSRLPIIQGGTFSFLTPTLAMLSLPKWKCPAWTENATLVNASSPEFIEVWQTRMREVYHIFSGTCSVSGLFAFRKAPYLPSPMALSLCPVTASWAPKLWCCATIEQETKNPWLITAPTKSPLGETDLLSIALCSSCLWSQHEGKCSVLQVYHQICKDSSFTPEPPGWK